MIAVTDLFGNGELEVVIGSTNSTVYCLNGTSGNQVWSYRTYGHVTHSPVVTDLFGDGNKEVIALSENGNIYVLDGLTGSAVWNYTKLGYVATTPVLADVDGDSRQEIIVASFDNGVYCLSPDIAPPATVTDLTAGNADDTSIVLTWTAPGDDDMIGNVSAYIVKYSTAGPVNGSNWASATTYDQSWIPAKNGTGETRIISGLTPTTTYWFAVRACDEASNYGDISNSPSATTTGVGTIIMFCGIAAASVIIDIVVIMLVKSSKPRRDYSNT
jgi:outer membrane protein assembly factor BamB